MQDVFADKIKAGSFESCDLLNFINTMLLILPTNEIKYIIVDNATIHKLGS